MWREERRHAVHFGFALQNLSRGRRPIKSHSNVQKSASSFCTLAWLSALLMPNAQKEKPSAHSLCAKGECLAVPPFLADDPGKTISAVSASYASLSSVTGSPGMTYPRITPHSSFLQSEYCRKRPLQPFGSKATFRTRSPGQSFSL